VRIRNQRPGPLVIADARLRLRPGEVVRVDVVTPHIQGALRRGLLEEVPENTPLGAPAAPKPAPAPPTEYDRLSVAEAIEQVGEETDPTKLDALLKTEKRKTVLDALKRRLQEVKPGGTQ